MAKGDPMTNEVQTKIKTFVAAEKVATESWVKKYRGWLLAVGVAAVIGFILAKGWLWPSSPRAGHLLRTPIPALASGDATAVHSNRMEGPGARPAGTRDSD